MRTVSQPGAKNGTQPVDGVDERQRAIARGQRPAVGRSGSPILTLVTVVVEMIPGGLGPWGIGDVVTAIEALAGRTIDGLRLSMSERLVCLGASAIPLVPARPIVGVNRMLTGAPRSASQQPSRPRRLYRQPAPGEWRRTYGARQRSQPQSFHEFVDG